MFYVTQVYIPNTKLNSSARECVRKRIKEIKGYMLSPINALGKTHIDNWSGDYTEKELKKFKELKLSDKVNIVNATKNEYFTAREWIKNCLINTEVKIDKLNQYYANHISAPLMDILEIILNSAYHQTMKIVVAMKNDSKINADIILEYYKLASQLELISKREYS